MESNSFPNKPQGKTALTINRAVLHAQKETMLMNLIGIRRTIGMKTLANHWMHIGSVREKSKHFLVAILAVMVLSCGHAFAQSITATLVGTVQDVQGAVIPGASITATNTGTGISQTTTSGGQGEYRIEPLPVGNYSVSATAAGFKKITQQNVTLNVDQTQRVDLTLAVGATSDTVTVNSIPPQVNTSTAEIGGTVENEEITTLPIVGRNVYTLLTLTPGVQQSTEATLQHGFPIQTTYINGGANNGQSGVSYYLDGGINMTFSSNTGLIVPNPDAVDEFRVETSNYSAEYGRFGAGVITVVTKSGTNRFDGSLFEFYRDGAFNATPWDSLTNPPLHRNQFGATIGGPIIHDRTFFFGSYGGLRQVTSTVLNTAVLPTALERQGNFSQSSIIPYDPTTGKVFDYNNTPGWIPPTRLDPTALALLNPPAGLPGIPSAANEPGNVYQGVIVTPYNTDEFLIKVDHSLTQSQKVTLHYYNTSGLTSALAGGNLPWSTETSNWRQQNAVISHTWTINPAMVNQAWVNFAYTPSAIINLPADSLHQYGSDYQVQGTPSLPQLAVSGYFTLGEGHAEHNSAVTYAFRDVAQLNRGRHALAFGGEAILSKIINPSDHTNYGQFAFTGVETEPKGGKGNPLADYMLGLPATLAQQSPELSLGNSWSYGIFLQDEFRITRRLTLTPSIRYDLQTPITEKRNFENTFVPGRQSTVVPSAPLGQLFAGDPGIGRGVIPARKDHISPRLGVAWDPFGDGKTSVRAAAGVFFGSVSFATWNVADNFSPFSLQESFNTVASLTHPYADLPGGVSPFPYTYNPSNPVYVADAELSGTNLAFHWPYTYQTNFSIQRQITKDLSLTGAYVGSYSHNLPLGVDLNYPIWSSTATSKNVNARRPIDTNILSEVLSVESGQTSSYNGLQIIAEQRTSHGVSFRAFYTYSKNRDSVGQYGTNTTAAGNAPQDYDNLWEDRGLSPVDQRHMFVASAVWDVSYWHGDSLIVRNVLNGWQISPIVTLDSGTPLSFLAGSDTNLDGNNTDRPNFVAGQVAKLDPHRGRSQAASAWFNKAAFTASGSGGIGPGGADGNVPIAYLNAPGYRDVDMGIFRNFHVYDRDTLQLRLESTNIFNMVSLSPPTTTLTSSLFGQISSASAMRQLQLGARVTF
jgi:hypothetical protein